MWKIQLGLHNPSAFRVSIHASRLILQYLQFCAWGLSLATGMFSSHSTRHVRGGRQLIFLEAVFNKWQAGVVDTQPTSLYLGRIGAGHTNSEHIIFYPSDIFINSDYIDFLSFSPRLTFLPLVHEITFQRNYLHSYILFGFFLGYSIQNSMLFDFLKVQFTYYRKEKKISKYRIFVSIMKKIMWSILYNNYFEHKKYYFLSFLSP